jgi:hypothetical protein
MTLTYHCTNEEPPDDAPNLIYTPEKPFSVVQFLVYARPGPLHRLDIRGHSRNIGYRMKTLPSA